MTATKMNAQRSIIIANAEKKQSERVTFEGQLGECSVISLEMFFLEIWKDIISS